MLVPTVRHDPAANEERSPTDCNKAELNATQTLLVLLLLVGAICGLTLVARRVPISGPVFVTIGGIVLGFIPRFPSITLDPELVLLIILEPLVYSAAVELPWQDFQVNARSISLFAITLVAMTIVTVAAMVHAMIPAITWPQAFRFGAIISPTDPVASTQYHRD